MTPTVVIAGAGIGGLTLAIALRRRGVPVTVLERAPERSKGSGGTLDRVRYGLSGDT
jgi:salicylate hydroxylase